MVDRIEGIGRRRSRVRVDRRGPEAGYRILELGEIRSFNWLRKVYEMGYS